MEQESVASGVNFNAAEAGGVRTGISTIFGHEGDNQMGSTANSQFI